MSLSLRMDDDEDERATYRDRIVPLSDTSFGDYHNEANDSFSYIPNNRDDEVKKPKFRYKSKGGRKQRK